jgi:3-methyladenine DNA glycosylase AlkD
MYSDRKTRDLTPAAVLAWLERRGSRKVRDGMARYGLPADRAFGVPIGVMQRYAKDLGRDHDLALALWDTGWYEARTVAAFVAEPERLTPAQMDRWCRDFDSWGICDTVCFHLFDRTPHAWKKIAPWSRRREEFVKRGAFALLACLALHDKAAADARFLGTLPLIERGAADDRNFVKKGVSWALRLIGRRNVALNAAAVAVSRRLAASTAPSARWIGRGALKELTSAAVVRRLAAGRKKPAGKPRRSTPAAKPASGRGGPPATPAARSQEGRPATAPRARR